MMPAWEPATVERVYARMRLRLAVVFLAALALAACNAASVATPSPSGTSAPGTPTASVPASPTATATTTAVATATAAATAPAADPDVAVVRIEQVGGMLPLWITLQFYPDVALYADGRLITRGPQDASYPGPAVPNLVVVHVSERGVGQVLDWAAEAGLQGDDRELGEPLLDAGVTMFTIVRPDGVHHTSVTNLDEPGVEIAAAAQFLRLMQELPAWLPEDIASNEVPYEWDRLRVISSPADPTVVADPDLVTELDWPLADLAAMGESLSEPPQYRCFVVAGDDLALVRPMAKQANLLTVWNSGGEQYQLSLHPLLPDDEDCPGF